MTSTLIEGRLKAPRIQKIPDPNLKQRVTIYLTSQELRDAKVVAATMGVHLANLGREAIRRMIYVNAPDAEMIDPNKE
jgi:hypothetical protein